MATVHDVAAYILKKKGRVTAMKLQKLLYYSQAWSLVWDDRPIFKNDIQAWANGPVVRAVYDRHKGMFYVDEWTGDPRALTKNEKETVDAVLTHYGDKTSQWLSELSHRESPWLNARRGVKDGERSEAVISHASMAEYYGSL